MKKILFSLLLMTIGLNIYAQQYTVVGDLTGFANGTKFYLRELMSDTDVDSALLTNGKFTMRGKTSAVKAYWLHTTYANNFFYTNLLFGAEKISIKGDAKDFPWHLNATGSVNQDVLNILNSQTKDLWKEREPLVNVVMPILMGPQTDSTKKISDPLIKEMRKIDSALEAITLKFIDEHRNSYAALRELFWKRNKYSKEEFANIFASVAPIYKNSSFGRAIANYLKVGEPLKKGDTFYDFTAADINGKNYKLSDYKGKYILLDFTETYCGPCILSAEGLKELSKTYADRLQVISFYAESKKEVMREGIARDKFTWPCVWDGKGDNSEIKLKYGIQSFPTFVLIDPNGKIILRLSGYGKDDNGKGNLENAVDKLLQASK